MTVSFMFLLIVLNLVLLAIEVSWPRGSDTMLGAHWTDWGLLAIFICYTLEASAKIIAFGLIYSSPEDDDKGKLLQSTGDTPSSGDKGKLPQSTADISSSGDKGNTPYEDNIDDPSQSPTRLGELSSTRVQDHKGDENTSSNEKDDKNGFLRCPFNRMDTIAIVCFWIDLVLMVSGVRGVYIFKSLAVLRTLRLLNITFGTRDFLSNLESSVLLLLKISLSIAFFFAIFSLIGLQAFKGSYTRRCVLTADNSVVLEDQFCSGSYKELGSMETVPYITLDGELSLTSPNGYICPHNYQCKDTGEYHGSDFSFDNILGSMVQVYMLMTGQTWTDIMYKIMNSVDNLASIYFVVVILVMNFWILNLFVAVIIDAELTSDEASEETNQETIADSEEIVPNPMTSQDSTWRKEQLRKMEFFWVLAIIADLVFQCLPEYKSPKTKVLSFCKRIPQ
ncbi:Ion transport protein-domain-containing protein [Mortierella sp. GBAus27b]|nr:Ion transport protein-domain-containing protein [Mortierella sp. GBAus27b]